MSAAGRHGPSRGAVVTAVAVVAGLALYWTLLLGGAERSVFALVPILDEVWYLDRAAELDGLRPPPDRVHFVSPLYPVLVALAGADGGVPADRVVPPAVLRGLRILQLACWAGTLLLLRWSAARLLPDDAPGRRWLVWLPSLLVAGYRPAAVYALAVLVELPLLLAVTAGLALAGSRSAGRGRLAADLALGLVLGLAGLLRGTAFVLVPVAAAWFLSDGSRSRRGRIQRAVLVVLAAALVALPAVVHNSRLAGRPVGPTLNGGLNLAIGNGPAANGFYVAIVPGDWRHDPSGSAHLAAELGVPALDVAGADSVWTARAVAEMTRRPWRAAGLWARKVWLHLQAWEIDQLMPLDGWRRTVPPLGLLVVPWALVVILAGAGAADVCVRRCAGGRLVLVATAALLAAQSLFFVVSRYRLALLPGLALLAAVGVAALLRRRRPAWIALAVVVPLVVPWGLGPVQTQWRAQALANEAHRRAEYAVAGDDRDELTRAIALYRRALEGGAEGPAPWLGLAAALQESGDPGAAEAVLEQGLLREPDRLEMHKLLVSLLLADGRADEALPRLRTVVARWPGDADSLHNLTVLLAGAGRLDTARGHAERLVALHPGDPRGYNDLAVLLVRAGRPDEAARVLRQGLAAVPDDPDLAANLARLAARPPSTTP